MEESSGLKRKHTIDCTNEDKSSEADRADSQEQKRLKEIDKLEYEANEHQTMEKCSQDAEKTQDTKKLEGELKILNNRIKEKEEVLRKLQMVKRYRTKNNLVELEDLIIKWRCVCQEALQDLHLKMGDRTPSLTELIDYLQIDHKLILYNQDEESFM